MNPHNTMNLRKINTEKVRNALVQYTSLTKSEIASVTGLSLATCTNILKTLVEQGEIENIKEEESTGGRKAKRYYFNRTFARVLCTTIRPPIDEKGIDYEIVNMFGETEYKYYGLKEENNFEDIVKTIEDIMNKFPNVKGLGFSVAGVITQKSLFTGMESHYEVNNFEQAIEEYFKLPVYIDNNANLAMQQFAKENHLDTHQSAALIIDVFGSGIYVNGTVCHGYHGFGGELFNFPDDSQPYDKVLSSEGRRHFLSRVCLGLFTIIDPYIIILCNGNDLPIKTTVEDVEYIKQYILEHIEKQFLPKFVIIDQFDELVLKGLKNGTLDKIKSHYENEM